jgi:hypothetical protein
MSRAQYPIAHPPCPSKALVSAVVVQLFFGAADAFELWASLVRPMIAGTSVFRALTVNRRSVELQAPADDIISSNSTNYCLKMPYCTRVSLLGQVFVWRRLNKHSSQQAADDPLMHLFILHLPCIRKLL